MTIASGMRSIHRRKATAISDGGTGATTAPEALAALGAPTLEGDNVFTGTNTFNDRILVGTVQAIGDLTFLTTDVFNFEDGGGTNYVEFLGAGHSLAFPDAEAATRRATTASAPTLSHLTTFLPSP